MSYKIKKVFLQRKAKAFKFLMDTFQLSISEAQKWIDKKRLYENKKLVIHKSKFIEGEIEIIVFTPTTRGLRPIFETKDFAVFDKPSGVLVHPTFYDSDYSLTHEIKYLYGKDANIVHRLDKETSGVIIASKHKTAEKRLKNSFEKQKIKKGYLALVDGKIDTELFIDAPIYKAKEELEIRLKVIIDDRGKPSQTKIVPLKYFKNTDSTLVEAIPFTGRQHQIRVHLFHMKHKIIGDPLYGVETKYVLKYLKKELKDTERVKATGARRMMLHANWIEFKYDNCYKIYSKTNLCQ